MDLAGPALTHDRGVPGCDVADVRDEAVVREERIEPPHEAVAGDLGDDRGGRDRGALLVSVDDCRVVGRGRPEPEAVDETRLGRRRQLPEHGAEPGQVAAMQAGAVDLAVRDHTDGYYLRAGDHRPEELLAPLGCELLRVVQECERTDSMVAQLRVVEQDARDDERAGERAPAGLVSAGDETSAEPPVEAQQPLPRFPPALRQPR